MLCFRDQNKKKEKLSLMAAHKRICMRRPNALSYYNVFGILPSRSNIKQDTSFSATAVDWRELMNKVTGRRYVRVQMKQESIDIPNHTLPLCP